MYGNYGSFTNYTNPYFQYRPMQYQNQPMQTPITQAVSQAPVQSSGLQGKLVDSLDMVKSVEFPFDGSVSFFPLTDGSAIVTKQLQMDGTAKTTIYKPVELDENKKNPENDFNEKFKVINEDSVVVKEKIDLIEKQISDFSKSFKEFLENNKGGKK